MTPSHSTRCRFWQLIREMTWSTAKYLLVMAVTVGPLYLVICMARDHSVPGYIAWIPDFARQYGTWLFVLAIGTVLVLYRAAHKSSAKPDDKDQPDQPDPSES